MIEKEKDRKRKKIENQISQNIENLNNIIVMTPKPNSGKVLAFFLSNRKCICVCHVPPAYAEICTTPTVSPLRTRELGQRDT
jgi:hypothetical protein